MSVAEEGPSTDYPLHVHELVEGEVVPEIEGMREPSEATIAALLEALKDIERIASARHGGDLEDAVFAIRITAASAIAKAEKRS